jgi:hypothetical protein
MTVSESIRALGILDAKSYIAACCNIGTCEHVSEDALVEIRAILAIAGDSRAGLPSLGYRIEGKELMAAYVAGWDSMLDA